MEVSGESDTEVWFINNNNETIGSRTWNQHNYNDPMMAECQAIFNAMNFATNMKENKINVMTDCKSFMKMFDQNRRRSIMY